jgi:hypothetical protein
MREKAAFQVRPKFAFDERGNRAVVGLAALKKGLQIPQDRLI